MKQRIAIKRIKRNLLARLWLSNWMNSAHAVAMLNLEQCRREEDILNYAISLNTYYQDMEFESAFKESTKLHYFKKKLFRKIIYTNIFKIINTK